MCVYINTGIAWVLENTTVDSSSTSCATSTKLLVRDTEISFKKHTVGQFRQAVATEFSLKVDNIIVRSKRGLKQGLSTFVSELFPAGFELTIMTDGATEKYSCP